MSTGQGLREGWRTDRERDRKRDRDRQRQRDRGIPDVHRPGVEGGLEDVCEGGLILWVKQLSQEAVSRRPHTAWDQS